MNLHQASGSLVANEAIQRIAALGRIEAMARALSPCERQRWRQQDARPRIDDLGNIAHRVAAATRSPPSTAPSSDGPLTRYLDGRYPIDNSPIENAIRPIALGRRNWLFAGLETAGRRVAAIRSLLANAKVNGHEPNAWLTDVLRRLPTALDREVEALLPPSCQPRLTREQEVLRASARIL